MKIKNLDLKNLRNEEHFHFQTGLTRLLIHYKPASMGIEKQYQAYSVCYKNEEEAIDIIRKSAITDEITEADHLRDSLFRGMCDALKAAYNHFNPEVRKAVLNLQPVFDHYGNPTRKPYDEETSAINNLVKELQTNYVTDIATVGITDWLTELKLKNESFDNLKNDRYTETASKTQLKMKEVRTAIDIVYHSLIEQLNALIIVNGPSAYINFVNELNERIDNYNLLSAQHKGVNSKNTEESITGTL